MAVGPTGAAQMSFDDACRHVVAHLKEHVPFACWSVSRIDPDEQVHLWLDDDAYGMRPGVAQPWTETFCQYMLAGITPAIAPDAMAVPEYAAVAERTGLRIGAYAGVPIVDGHGALFGTLCGFDPAVHDDDLLRHAPLLQLMAGLLGRIVHVERVRDEAVDRAEELRWGSLHDTLTGLTGRATFLDLLGRAADRDTSPRPALVLIDVDDLATVNDTFGQAAGDRLLVEFAARLSGTLHPFDTLARLGGDEFAILLHDGADLDATAARVDTALRAPVIIDGTPVPVSASVGVALVDGAAPDVLLTRARIAREIAADRSAGRWVVHEPAMTPRDIGIPTLREPLREAIRSGAVQAVYQPIVRLQDGRVVAYEALARWTHDGVPVPPDVFVPLAARAGLLPDLTDHMIDLAAGRLAGWSDALGHQRLRVGVNVPPGLLLDPGFPDRVAAAVQRHGLGRRQLVLEVTEDSLLDDLPTARAVATRLHDLGVMLSLDDVGSGYASLLHLRHLPLDAAKIDRVFVDDVDTSEDARHFLCAVLTCGRDLGLQVVVEGVERATQAGLLRSLGATYAQGHHFGHPALPDDIDVVAATTS
ncbi:putative bifunctional diguanylate cyclase/phosphodiesterase [Pseudonocardia saturnea]